MNPIFFRMAGFVLVLLIPSTGVMAADGIWTNTVNGVWSNTAAWDHGQVADGSDFTADFSALDLPADLTVTLDSARTIGNVKFGDTNLTSAASWFLTNGGIATNKLTLAGATPTITVNTLGPGKSANISAILAGNSGLNKSGDGVLNLSAANIYSGGTTVQAGTLQAGIATAFGSGTNAVVRFAASSTGKVQLNNFDITLACLSTDPNTGTPVVENGGANARTLTLNIATNTLYAGKFQKGAAGNLALLKLGSGLMTLTGSSTVGIGGNVTVNGGGLTISDGGDLVANETQIGTGATNNSNALTVTGSGSSLNLSAYVRVGVAGDANSLSVSAGAGVSANNDITVGTNGGSDDNILTVTGAGSAITSDGLEVGRGGTRNTLTISNGGRATTFYLWLSGGRVNPVGSSANFLNVTGSGSVLTINGPYDIADRGVGSQFNISNGAVVNSTGGAGYFGYFGGANDNAITIDGSGSVWNLGAFNTLFNPDGDNNTYTIRNAGLMNASGQVNLGGVGNQSGTVMNIQNGGKFTGTTLLLNGVNNSLNLGNGTLPGLLEVNTLTLSAASARVNIDQGMIKARAAGVLISGSGQVQMNGPASFSTAFASSIGSAITGSGSLTKKGGGTLTLSSLNYTGDTIVEEGTLVLTQPSLANGSTVTIGANLDAAAVLKLNYVATNTVDKLYIDGVQMPVGTYGSSITTAEHTDDLSFDSTGPGVLKVLHGPSAGSYAAWIAPLVPPGSDAQPDFDYDGDGFDNALEYILGGDPNHPGVVSGVSGSNGLLAVGRLGGNLVVSFERSNLSETPDVEVAFELGPDLVSWPESYIVGTSPFISALPSSTPAYKVVTLSLPILPNDVRKCCRLRITVTPSP